MARPAITDENKNLIVQKLEPYLKAGMPLNEACFQAQVPRSTVYFFMDRDQWFLDKIRLFQQYLGVVVNTVIVRHLMYISQKQSSEQQLNRFDLRFLMWYATHSNLTTEEFGRNKIRSPLNAYDPDEEMYKLYEHLQEPANNPI